MYFVLFFRYFFFFFLFNVAGVLAFLCFLFVLYEFISSDFFSITHTYEARAYAHDYMKNSLRGGDGNFELLLKILILIENQRWEKGGEGEGAEVAESEKKD